MISRVRFPNQVEVVPKASFLRTAFILSAMLAAGSLQPVSGQHVMPLPGCPSRGLSAPVGDGSLVVHRDFGCSLSNCLTPAEGEESDAPIFLLPEAWHQFQAVTGEYIYTGEIFSKVRGGLTPGSATRYRGNLDLVLTADTSALDLWSSGRFFVYAGAMHGRTLTPTDVGDFQFYSNIEADPRPSNLFQINEYWYEHAFADGDILVKVGKQDANADFAYVDLGGDFVNSSFALNPTVPLPTWPNPGLGASVFVQLTDLIQCKTGIYDGSPGAGVETGGQWGFSSLGDNGMISLFELSLTPQFGEQGELPGAYRCGSWYHSGDFDNLTTGVGTVSGSYGCYASVDQLLWREPNSDDDPQGLGVFTQYGWAPPGRSELNHYFGAGLTYRGPVRSRNADIAGVGIAAAFFSDPSLQTEQAIEFFYKAQINNWMIIQPDIQYIAGPGGTERDALVIGLRTEMAL